MYPNYRNYRKKLGFSCIKDIRAGNQISDLINFLKRTKRISVAYVIRKGQQLFILIFSKEVLVALLICGNSMNVKPVVYVYRPSSEVYQCCISKSNNSEFKEILKSPSSILDSILKFHGGSSDLNDLEMLELDPDNERYYCT
jgi:hypothetical protein